MRRNKAIVIVSLAVGVCGAAAARGQAPEPALNTLLEGPKIAWGPCPDILPVDEVVGTPHPRHKLIPAHFLTADALPVKVGAVLSVEAHVLKKTAWENVVVLVLPVSVVHVPPPAVEIEGAVVLRSA